MRHFGATLALALAAQCLVFSVSAQRGLWRDAAEQLGHLRQQFSSGGDGDGLMSGLLQGWLRPFETGTFNATPAPGASAGACDVAKTKAFAQIQVALQLALTVTSQPGQVDFGFLGDAGETEACAGQTCAYTNPSSPYGLSILPLSPSESVTTKIESGTMPSFVAQDIRLRNGFPSQPSLIDKITGAAASTSNRSSTSSASPGQQARTGASSAWQLLPDEVVLLAGCLPPASATRYFAVTHYLHSLYDQQGEDWVSVFGAMGDSIGAYVHPDSSGSLPGHGIRNRINSTLPGSSTPVTSTSEQPVFPAFGSLAWGDWLFGRATTSSPPQSAAAPPSNSAAPPSPASPSAHTSTSPAPSTSLVGSHKPWSGLLNQSMADTVLASAAELLNKTMPWELPAQAASSDPFGQFTIVLMGASPEAVQRVQGIVDPVLWRLGLSRAVNVLPITPPFSAGIGLQAQAPYFMLLIRNILGAAQRPAFKQYLASDPWRVWRITPRSSNFVLLERLRQPFNSNTSGFPPPQVIPRMATGVRQSEEWLRPAMNWLLRKLNQTLTSSGHVLSWSLGADSGLESAGVDWGIDCYRRRIDFCNGDNRDAQYIVSLPLLSLDQASKVAYVVGVNHVNTGLASYLNIAPSDPVQRLGLQAWDDQEMAGSADTWMSRGPYAGLSSLFYVLGYARNCTGIRYCKEIPLTGPRSLPLARRMLLLVRAYVNPTTGVGPPASALLKLRTVVATPVTSAVLPTDSRSLVLYSRPQTDVTCRLALTSTSVSCPQVLMSAADGGGGGTDREARRVLPTLQRVSRSLPNSDCCNAASSWAEERCWCTVAGQALLDALSPLPARALLASVGRMCGQPVRRSLAGCT